MPIRATLPMAVGLLLVVRLQIRMPGWSLTATGPCLLAWASEQRPHRVLETMRHRAPELPSKSTRRVSGNWKEPLVAKFFVAGARFCMLLAVMSAPLLSACDPSEPPPPASQPAGRPDQYRAAGGKHGPWRTTQGCELAVNRAQNFASAGEHGSSRPVGAFSASWCGVSSATGRCSHPPALRNTEGH